MYAALSEANEALFRLHDERELFHRICDIAVQYGGLMLAAIRLIDPASGYIRPVASAGKHGAYLERVVVSVDPKDPLAHGPAGQAAREGRTTVSNDFQRDPDLKPWHAAAEEAGIASTASVPLRRGGVVIGLLSIYAAERDWFDAELVSLLERLAANVSFSLDSLDRDARRQRAEIMLAGERSVLEMIALGKPVSDVLATLVRAVESQSGDGLIGSVLLLDAQGKRLRHGAAPGLPAAYCAAIDGLEIGPQVGSCGTAAYTGRRVIVSDIRSDPLWAGYRELAAAHELGACWSTPIKSRAGKVLGTFAMYYREPRSPSAADLELIERTEHLAGIVLERDLADVALRDAESHLRMIFDALPLAIGHVGRDERYVAVNVSLETLLERSRDEIVGYTVREVLGEEAYAEIRPHVAAVLQGKEVAFERRRKRADGSTLWLRVQYVPEVDAVGVKGYFALVSDISDQKRAELATRESEERFRSLTKLSSDFYWETDAAHRFMLTASAGGIKAGAGGRALGKTAWEVPSVQPSPEGWSAHQAVMEGHLPFRDFEFARQAADGTVRWYSVSGEPVFNAAGDFTGYRGVGRDVGERKRAEQDLERLAHYDKLTGLPNRAMLQDRLAQALLRARRNETLVAVMFLDLDRFKEVNDSLGHAAGDELLHGVAKRIAGSLRGTDTVARLGGDEFTVLLEGVRNVAEIEQVARKILAAVAEPLRVGTHDLFVSTSIGVTVFPLDDQDQQTLLKNADMAMYHAKQEGRNNVQFFAPEMGAHTERRMDLSTRLRHAVERGELSAHYQPLVEVASGRLVGLEALLRWENPEVGKVSPAQFIPIAEDTGLIVPIGEWMLRAVCRQMRTWRRAGCAPGYVAVNLSPRQFRQQDLVDTVARVLREYRMPPDSLELEITESTVMHRTEEAIMKMRRLRQLGVRIAIDDFGTGYSSLAYLQRFPVHTLKIDQSFVRDIRSDRDRAAIVATVIGLAKNLELTALAEGVETREQLDFLKANGCELYQGYFFGRPVAVAEIEPLLNKQAALDRPVARRQRPRSGPSRSSRA